MKKKVVWKKCICCATKFRKITHPDNFDLCDDCQKWLRETNLSGSKIKSKKKPVTIDQVDEWVGNYGDYQKRNDWMLDTILEIANGKYTAEELLEDIRQLTE